MKRIYQLNEWDLLKKELGCLEKRIIFTNGCFDLLHHGHLSYLEKARQEGDVLVVGLNSDVSVRRLKGNKRPIISQKYRAYDLSQLRTVDYVVIFDQDTPEELIDFLRPDVHVKGGDYEVKDLPEAKIVLGYGGKVKIVQGDIQDSTTNIVSRIVELNK